MQEPLFSILCTTCQAKLKVLSEAGIGSIQACPKCGSMVHVVPPPGWQPKPRPVAPADPPKSPGAAGIRPLKPTAPPLLPTTKAAEAAAGTPAPTPPAVPNAAPADGAELLPESAVVASTAGVRLTRWLLLGSVPMALILAGIGIYALWHPTRNVPVPPIPANEATALPAKATSEGPKSASAVAQFDPRWLPNQTRLWLSLRIARLGNREEYRRVVEGFEPAWRASVERLFDAFGLKTHAVARLQWASTELGDWADHCVAVIELEKNQDAKVFQVVGQAFDLKLAGTACRRLSKPSWPHPFAVLDARTIVTGHADLLRELVNRKETHLANAALAHLLEATSPEADAALLVDLAAARQARWKLPTGLLDVWPAGRDAWHALWEVPKAMAFTVQTVDHNRWELGLTCEGEVAAKRVHAALEQLLPAAKAGLDAQSRSLAALRTSGRITAEVATQYERFLQQSCAEIDKSRREIMGATVWLRLDSPHSASDAASAAWASRDVIRGVWLEAARAADAANHGRLLEGLAAVRKAEGVFPAGAGGGALLPPETRLSWLASMLPYLGHKDWHEGLEFGYSWNGVQNRAVTSRTLSEVVNPALGPSSTEGGFPVTHYVGVAGVGASAGQGKPGDPRAGVFSFSGRMRLEDIADGAANTIATLGVQNRLGPWAAGGEPTVRALTQRPYVNGPDGFGSGQPNGMLAGMADGSVRFLSKDIDPTVLEQLATVRGGEPVTAAILDPKPAAVAQPTPTGPSAPTVANQPPNPRPNPPAAPAKAVTPIILDGSRLSDQVAKIEMPGVPLLEAIHLLSQMSTIPISFDLDAIATLGVDLRDPVTVRAEKVTVRGVLEALTASKGLAFAVDKGYVVVTTPEAYRTALRTERYSVADMVGSDAVAANALAEEIRRLIAPETWIQSGGRGSIDAKGNTLVINQTQAILDRVMGFCERLRMARRLTPKNQQLAKRLTLQSHLAQARATLARPVTTNFQQAAPLVQIVSDLEQLTESTILIHWPSLGEEGLSPQTEATLKVENRPLADALAQLLQPLGLSYRIVGRSTLEILSRKAAASRLELEFYPVADLLGSGMSIEQLMGQIRDAAGGSGAIGFDPASKYLMVLQSQPVQVGLEAVLSRQQAERAAKK